MSGRTQIFIALAAIGVAAITAAAWLWTSGQGIRAPGTTAAQNVPIGGPFALIDQNGRTRRKTDFQGRHMVVFFGYTNCPDVCPATLQTVDAALGRLGVQAERVGRVMITVDPRRDTPDRLKSYLGNFDPAWVGLTGTREAIEAATKAYHAYAGKTPDSHDHDKATESYQSHDSDSGHDSEDYLVDHSSVIYLMGPDGHYRAHFSARSTAERMAAAIAKFL